MKRLFAATIALLAVAVTVLGCTGYGAMYGSGWQTLIDGGTGLDNFDRLGDANWRAEGGAIVADKGKGGHLVSKKSYKDFMIYAEFWAAEDTNSGIFIRVKDPKKITATSAYEVNIFDKRPDPSYGTGAIVNYAVVSPMPRAAGQWNTYEIYARGSQLTVKLNGAITVNIYESSFPSGPFTLQYGAPGGVIKWRKVAIKEL